MIILLPKRTIKFQAAKKIILIKNKKLKHTNRSTTKMIIVPTKITSQVKVKVKVNLIKNQDINTKNQKCS